MLKNGRRNLLKMLGITPALLIPWKPASEQVVPPAPTPAVIEKLTLQEALDRIDWGAVKRSSAYPATGYMGYTSWPRREDDDGTV